jgi:hypothetical protein
MKMNFQHKPIIQKSTQNKKIIKQKTEEENKQFLLGNQNYPNFKNIFSLIDGKPCQSCPHSQN